MTLAYRIAELVDQHGSLRALGRFLGVDAAYLLRLSNGESVNPSDEVLEKLGLRKVVSYQLIGEDAHPQPATQPQPDKAAELTDAQIMNLLFKHSESAYQAMTFERWKDGIEIDVLKSDARDAINAVIAADRALRNGGQP